MAAGRAGGDEIDRAVEGVQGSVVEAGAGEPGDDVEELEDGEGDFGDLKRSKFEPGLAALGVTGDVCEVIT